MTTEEGIRRSLKNAIMYSLSEDRKHLDDEVPYDTYDTSILLLRNGHASLIDRDLREVQSILRELCSEGLLDRCDDRDTGRTSAYYVNDLLDEKIDAMNENRRIGRDGVSEAGDTALDRGELSVDGRRDGEEIHRSPDGEELD